MVHKVGAQSTKNKAQSTKHKARSTKHKARKLRLNDEFESVRFLPLFV